MAYEALTTDQVKITYGSYGDTVKQIEMLLMPKAKLTLAITENNTIQMTTSDVDFDNSNLSGELSYNDQLRNQALMREGWDVMRFWVPQVRDRLPWCIEQIKKWMESC